MKALFNNHKLFWGDKSFRFPVFSSFMFFVMSLFINYGAILYSDKKVGNATTDILLENIPVTNVDIVFSEGALLFTFFIILIFILKPKVIPFSMKSVALFVCVRSLFVIMTHLAPPEGHIMTDLGDLGYLSSGADLFFSGHTGMPFLFALIFWESKRLRYIFLSCSLIAGIAVLMGHLHYTIDVFSAFFITYGIYHIAQIIFKKDYQAFKRSLESKG